MIYSTTLEAGLTVTEFTVADCQFHSVCINGATIVVCSILVVAVENYFIEFYLADPRCGDHRRSCLVLYKFTLIVCTPDCEACYVCIVKIKATATAECITFMRVVEQLYGHFSTQCIGLIKCASLSAVTLRTAVYQSRVICPLSAFHHYSRYLILIIVCYLDYDNLVFKCDSQLFFCVEWLE